MRVVICEQSNKKLWDDYAMSHPQANCYHLYTWKEVIEDSFQHRCYYLMAISNGAVKGILPLIHMESRMFGKYLISLPYFNYGGLCASNSDAQEALLETAIKIASLAKTTHLELREQRKLDNDMPMKTHKVSMHLPLPENHDELWKSLKSKLRSQIRRPEKEGEVTFLSGGKELLEDFYHVFSLNMRKLGTPVYSKRFFGNILKRFPEKAKIHVLYLKGKAVSVGFTIAHKKMIEIPWAASLDKYKRVGVNMSFYWNVLKRACMDGFEVFDFGRSTVDAGTYKFKKQWGAAAVPLYWHYWLSDGSSNLPQLNPNNPKYKIAINIWKKIPLKMTQTIGPHIVKHLP